MSETNARLHIAADDMDVPNHDGSTSVAGVERVSLSFDAEDGGDAICQHCGEAIEQDSYGGWIDASTGDGGPTFCYSSEDHEADDQRHEPETGPGTWCNSAAIIVNDEEDSVTVSISVGDPRGAFFFTVRKVPTILNGDLTVANADLAGRLLLHVPHPGESLPHETLTELHAGTFLVGLMTTVKAWRGHVPGTWDGQRFEPLPASVRYGARCEAAVARSLWRAFVAAGGLWTVGR